MREKADKVLKASPVTDEALGALLLCGTPEGGAAAAVCAAGGGAAAAGAAAVGAAAPAATWKCTANCFGCVEGSCLALVHLRACGCVPRLFSSRSAGLVDHRPYLKARAWHGRA